MLNTICERLSKQIPGYSIFVDACVSKYGQRPGDSPKEKVQVGYKVTAIKDEIVFQSPGSPYLYDAADDVLRQYKESLMRETDTNSNKEVDL